jgi:hypothetical protein
MEQLASKFFFRIARVKDGWATLHFSEALVKLSSAATARKYLI